MFGGSSKNIGDDANGNDAKLRNQMARMMALTVFEISKDSGHVEMVEENCAGADDRLLHIFSGPLLGIVKFETSDDTGSGANDGGSSKSLTDAHNNDSPSSMMRSKRTESSVFAAITPTFASSGSGSGSFSETPSMVETDTSDVKKTYLEFYEWDSVQRSDQSKPPKLGDTLKKIGGAIECPLALEWERTTNRFCALIYPTSVKIYRVTATPPDLVCLHEIPTFQSAQSLKWVNHTLFFSTEDEVKCCVVSKTRCFTFDLASALVADKSLERASRDSSLQFPQPQVALSNMTISTALMSNIDFGCALYDRDCRPERRQSSVSTISNFSSLDRCRRCTRSICRTECCNAAFSSRMEKKSTRCR